MVSVLSPSPRHASSADTVVASATTPSDPVSLESANATLTQHFAELMRLVDPRSREGRQIGQWLKGIGDRLLAADGTKLTHEVSYHLSDAKELEANSNTGQLRHRGRRYAACGRRNRKC